tara:strand:+ start:215 stop:460 length:246 start_codon:yes stop_codon:yes gene_type:complete
MSRFQRKDGFEIENFNGKIDSSKIKWISNCEFILTKLNPLTNQEKRPIKVKIISTTEDSYTFEYSLVGYSKETKRGVVEKL